MNIQRDLLSLLFAAATASAETGAVSPAPVAPAASTQNWMAATDLQWKAAFKRDVTDIYDSELAKLKKQYAASLEAGISKAGAAGDLDGALALRNEQKRFADAGNILGEDEATDPAAAKRIRSAARAEFARLEKDRATRAKALQIKYDNVLAQAQVQLTQHQRFDEALLIKTKRDEVAKEWLGETAAVAPVGAVEPAKPAATPASPAATARSTPVVGTQLFVNTGWRSPAGTSFVFLPEGKGFSAHPSRGKLNFHWHIRAGGMIEVDSDADNAGRKNTWFFKFVSDTEAYYGAAAKDTPMKLTKEAMN